ncbi:peptidoglycan DD-metalloendopeptidase family protein [Oceanobacillus sp. 143]|nr:peptidoglycan DD-metalloendopeptidase family protein [Oceanobacillus sp. 143]
MAAEKAAAEQEAAERAASERAASERASSEKASSEKSTNKVASANPTPPKQSNQSSNVSSGGTFIYPASGPITSSFGPRIHPIFGGQGSHNGIDFGVASGTTLVAPADGVVSTARYMNSFGNVIMISHHINGKTYTTVMAHLSRISVSPGQTVSQGEAIGATGNTGDSTGPHLHFEVHIGGYGNPVNPLSYLR